MKGLNLIAASLILFTGISFAAVVKQNDKNKGHIAPAPKTATLQPMDSKSKEKKDTNSHKKKLPPPGNNK